MPLGGEPDGVYRNAAEPQASLHRYTPLPLTRHSRGQGRVEGHARSATPCAAINLSTVAEDLRPACIDNRVNRGCLLARYLESWLQIKFRSHSIHWWTKAIVVAGKVV